MANLQTDKPRHKPRARKYRGITVTPTWEWSREYKAWRAERERDLQKDYMLPRAHRFDGGAGNPVKTRAIAYTLWLARRDGINLAGTKATRLVETSVVDGTITRRQPTWAGVREVPRLVTRCKAVEFLDYDNHGRSPTYYSGGYAKRDPIYIEPGVIARIEILNWDFVPGVAETTAEQPSRRRAA